MFGLFAGAPGVGGRQERRRQFALGPSQIANLPGNFPMPRACAPRAPAPVRKRERALGSDTRSIRLPNREEETRVSSRRRRFQCVTLVDNIRRARVLTPDLFPPIDQSSQARRTRVPPARGSPRRRLPPARRPRAARLKIRRGCC